MCIGSILSRLMLTLLHPHLVTAGELPNLFNDLKFVMIQKVLEYIPFRW